MTRAEIRKVWEERVIAFKASDQSANAWCREHDLKPNQLYYWRKKIEPQETAQTSSSKWLPLEVSDKSAEENSLSITVGQATVEVKPGFDPALLLEVVRTLKALC